MTILTVFWSVIRFCCLPFCNVVVLLCIFNHYIMIYFLPWLTIFHLLQVGWFANFLRMTQSRVKIISKSTSRSRPVTENLKIPRNAHRQTPNNNINRRSKSLPAIAYSIHITIIRFVSKLSEEEQKMIYCWCRQNLRLKCCKFGHLYYDNYVACAENISKFIFVYGNCSILTKI